jgi:hypothetical protein
MFLLLKLCRAFHNDTSLRAVNFQLGKGGRDGLKEFRRLFASSDDRLSTHKFFPTNNIPFDFVGQVPVGLGESPAGERFCNLMNI